MFWGRLDQNSGVHGNRKPPLTYNGENGVSTFSRLLLIQVPGFNVAYAKSTVRHWIDFLNVRNAKNASTLYA